MTRLPVTSPARTAARSSTPGAPPRRRLAAVLAAAVPAAAAVLALSAPAATAATGTVTCITIDGKRVCIEVPYAINAEYLHCPGCPGMSFVQDQLVTPADRRGALLLARGVDAVVQSVQLGDRDLRERGQALVEQAAATQRGPLSPAAVRSPWSGFAADVASAVNLYQSAAASRATRDPHADADAALDRAALGIAKHAVHR